MHHQVQQHFPCACQGLELDNMSGTIPARSKCVVIATVRPVRRVTYQYTISYQLLTPEGTLQFDSLHVFLRRPCFLFAFFFLSFSSTSLSDFTVHK